MLLTTGCKTIQDYGDMCKKTMPDLRLIKFDITYGDNGEKYIICEHEVNSTYTLEYTRKFVEFGEKIE